MKKNKWLCYFVYVLVLLCYITFSYEIVALLKKQFETKFEYLPYFLFSMIIYLVLGMLLGLERIVLEREKEGNWKINLPKLILLGVPFLYLSLGAFVVLISPMISYPILFFTNGLNYQPIFQIILGYTICTSFIKVKV